MKMEALKKAYAEIILNTSKEAAARVMVAERKARCFEQQLDSLRQESLSMLLRLKDHFNSTVKNTFHCCFWQFFSFFGVICVL